MAITVHLEVKDSLSGANILNRDHRGAVLDTNVFTYLALSSVKDSDEKHTNADYYIMLSY